MDLHIKNRRGWWTWVNHAFSCELQFFWIFRWNDYKNDTDRKLYGSLQSLNFKNNSFSCVLVLSYSFFYIFFILLYVCYVLLWPYIHSVEKRLYYISFLNTPRYRRKNAPFPEKKAHFITSVWFYIEFFYM